MRIKASLVLLLPPVIAGLAVQCINDDSGICVTTAIANRAPSDLESATPSTLPVTFSNPFSTFSPPTLSVAMQPTPTPQSGGSSQSFNKHNQNLLYPTILEAFLGVLFVVFCIGLGAHLRKRWRRRRGLGAPGGSAVNQSALPSGGPTHAPSMEEVPVPTPGPLPPAAGTSTRRNDGQTLAMDEAILEVPR